MLLKPSQKIQIVVLDINGRDQKQPMNTTIANTPSSISNRFNNKCLKHLIEPKKPEKDKKPRNFGK